MKYIVDHIPKNTPNNRRPSLPLVPEYITIHNTANSSSTARNERSWLTSSTNNRQASYHIVVDEKEAIECIPLNEVTWNAGDGGLGKGNRSSIAIEICESGDYKKTLDNAAFLVASLLKERGWGIDRLRRHYDWSRKNCPRLMNTDGKWTGWHEFLKLVEGKLDIVPKVDQNQPSEWAEEAVKWGMSNGITDGTRLKNTLTREEAITMLFRTYNIINKKIK